MPQEEVWKGSFCHGVEPSYQELRALKLGRFASVLLAREHNSGQLVALKALPRLGLNSAVEREILNQLQLSHPHILQLHQVLLTDEAVVLVLEHAPGGDLAGRVTPGEGVSEREARWIFNQLLFALDYVHSMGIAHRDVKLENVLVDSLTSKRPLVKLADFGLSVRTDARGCARHDGTVGTPVYLAPELHNLEACIRRELYNAQKADLWSLGVLLYALLTGTSPFQRVKDFKLSRSKRSKLLAQRIMAADYKMPRTISPAAQDLLQTLLVIDPAARPTVREVLEHAWCREGMALGTPQLLGFNDQLVGRAGKRGSPVEPEVIVAVQDILLEARRPRRAPRASGGAGGGSTSSTEESGGSAIISPSLSELWSLGDLYFE